MGMIEQSLCHYLESQLTEYYRLIAVLESQMNLTAAKNEGDSESRSFEEESGLTLKRLEVWVDDWRLRLRMMSACVEGCRDVTGGALVNLIHSYTANGDPFVRKVTDELLEEVWLPMLYLHDVVCCILKRLHRYQSLFSPCSTNGYSLANYMTRSPSSLSISTLIWLIFNSSNLLGCSKMGYLM